VRTPALLPLCLLMALAAACAGEDGPDDAGLGGSDTGVVQDAGQAPDSGAMDTGVPADAGEGEDAAADAGTPDTGAADAAGLDASPLDTGVEDTGPADTGPADTGAPDTGTPDTGTPDTGAPDTGAPDTGTPDTGVDAGTPDTGVADAGGVDAGTGLCAVQVNLPETLTGQVGSNGGSPGPSLECPAGAEIVGVAIRMSDGNTSNGGRSAVGMTVVCAAVTFDPSGVTVGPATYPEVAGTGQFGWTPATQSTITTCPDGWLVSGLSGSRGASGNRLVEVNMTCTELLPNGTTTGVPRDYYIMGTLQEAGTRDTVACPSGQVVRRFGTRRGAGFDAATVYCAAPACAP
jgi:hypothetical protein